MALLCCSRRAMEARRTLRIGEADAGGVEGRGGDPGYHLLGGGRAAFEAGIGFRLAASHLARAIEPGDRIGGYVSAVAVAAAVTLASPLFALAAVGLHGA